MHEALRRALTLVPDPLLRHMMYRRRFGRWGNFRSPVRFTEHLTRRMLVERGDGISWTCDKLRMKAYSLHRCPELAVPATLWSGVDLDALDLDSLPDQWVIKPNHRSGLVYFGDRSTTKQQLKAATRGWLRTHDRAAIGEWAYRKADHVLIIEPRLGGGTYTVPADYKFFVFHGRVRVLHCDVGRFTDRFGESFYTPEWHKLDIVHKLDIARGLELRQDMTPPRSLDQMVRYAGELGAGFDFMRVDFYEVNGRAYFGELTPYPSGGMDPFDPDEADKLLGSWWAEKVLS